jgi:hypothetical protein
MARGLIRWLGATLLACVIIAVVSLRPHRTAPPVPAGMQPTPVSAERARAQELAAEWQSAELQLRFVEARRQIEPELARRSTMELPSIAAVVRGPDSLVRLAAPLVEAALDSVWRDLGLGTTKIAVGVVVDVSARGGKAPAGTPFGEGLPGGRDTYLLPDSTDRGVCLLTVVVPNFSLPNYTIARLHESLKGSLGPCAFYARYGTPGARVRNWLSGRRFDLALSPSWDDDAAQGLAGYLSDMSGSRWWWPIIYSFPPRTVACLGSRLAACRQAVTDSDDGQQRTPLRPLIPGAPWDFKQIRLVGGDHFLADVARTVGDDRFIEFWNTTLPIDSALSLALRQPIGEWTVNWERTRIPTLPLSPVLRLHELLPGLLLVGLALLLVVALVRRREVR